MTTLIGTEKQITWATEIRAADLPKAEAAYADWTAKTAAAATTDAIKTYIQAALDAKIAEIRNRVHAAEWIDARSLSGDMQIYAAMREAVKAAQKA